MANSYEGATLFVEPHEFEDYELLHGKRFNIVKLKKDNGGFGFLINSMLNYAIKRKFKYYIFSDDDIISFSFRDKESNLLREVETMLFLAEKNKYAQLMMSFQPHNWYFKEALKEKVGCWCFVMNRTKCIKAVGGADEELPIFNDWELSAKLIKKGYKTACYYGAMFSHKMMDKKGGAEFIYKDKALLKKAREMLKERYGDRCVKIVKAHGQEEVRFRWSRL